MTVSQQVALSNMDTVLLEARGVLEGIAPHLLKEMEVVQKAQFDPACPTASNSPGLDSCQQCLTRRPTASQGQQTFLPSIHAAACFCR